MFTTIQIFSLKKAGKSGSLIKIIASLCFCMLTVTSALAQTIQPADLVKHYTHYPVQNGYHQVDIVLNGSNLVWSNAAGVSWGLSLSNGVLTTQSNCPYGIQTIPIRIVLLADGSTQVRGLTFMSDYYKATIPLAPAYAKMIPLRDANYQTWDYSLSLTGPAISGTTPYEIRFDTGSWETCIPYGAINTNNITVLQANTTDGWGVPADMVQGTLSAVSADGTTTYTLSNFVFFARLNAPDDRTTPGGNAIMGAFPSIWPQTGRPSFPFALAQKYSNTNSVGLGIVSEVLQNFQLSSPWAKSYLAIGSDPQITTNLNWRSDLPPWTGYSAYCPYRVPGFGVTFKFTNAAPDIVVTSLNATVDSGAPDLVLKVATNDPQRSVTYSGCFTTNTAPWYSTNALNMVPRQNVIVSFTSDTGKTITYGYTNINDYSANQLPPGNVTVGDWNSSVPWPVTTDTPTSRINLGNSIYFFCPVYFWDVSNNRVGVSDFTGWKDTNAPTPNPMTFAVAPVANSPTSIFMTATPATDLDSPPVSYYFQNTTNAANSGWISSTVWTNTGLTPGVIYGYHVKARDAVSNETAWSSVVSIACLASTNAYLSNLVASAGILSPAFSSNTFSYTAIVPNATTSLALTPTAADATANITVNGSPVASGNPSSAISLNVGTNLINTVVISADLSQTNTYSLTLTRTALWWWDGGGANILTNGDGLSAGGGGTWNASLTNWDQGSGQSHAVWNNTNLNLAIFGGMAGTVTNTVNITVGGLIFTSNYTLTNTAGASLLFGAAGMISNNAVVKIATPLGGTGPINNLGAGTTILAGSNTYSGGLVVSAGTLEADNNFALGTGLLTMSSGGLSNNVTGITLTNPVNLATAATVGMPAGTNFTLSGTITNYGSLTKVGAGTLTLSGTNTYTGGTIVGNGTLALIGVAAQPANSTLAISNGATVNISAGADSTWPATTVTGAGTLVANTATGRTITLASYNMSGFTGILDITASGGSCKVGLYAPFTINNSATLKVENGSTAYYGWMGFSLGCNVELYGAGNIEGLGALRLENNDQQNGPVLLKANSQIGGSGGFGYIGGVISDGGLGYGFTDVGTATIVLQAANTYSGGTVINGGGVQLAHALAMQNSTATLSVSNGLTFATGIGTFTLGGLTGSKTLNLQDTGASAINLQVGNNNATTTYSGTLSGTGSLNKIGTGTLTLTGTNSYSGSTLVNTGTLLVNSNSLAVTNTVTVLTNAMFGGTGMIGGVTRYQNGSSSTFTITPTSNGYSNSTYMTFTNLVYMTNMTVGLSMPNNLAAGTYVLATNYVSWTTSGTLTFVTNSGSLATNSSGMVSVTNNCLILKVSNVVGSPTITGATNFASAFTNTYGTASAAQTYPVAGANLTASITNTAASGFEVSGNGGVTYSSTVIVTNVSGSASNTVYIRLAATASAGNYNSSNIVVLASAFATSITNTSSSSGNGVAKANATFTVTPYSVAYDGVGHTATVTTIAGVNGETNATVGTVNVSATTHTNAGSYASDAWTFTPTANYNTNNGTVSDTINKTPPVLSTTLTASAITYGQGLSNSVVTGGIFTNASGAMITMASTNFVTPGIVPNAGTTNVLVYFAPTNMSYANVTNSVTVTVNKANTSIAVTGYNVAYDGVGHTATVTVIAGVNGETNTTVGTVNVSATTHTNAGSYVSDAWTFTPTANYNTNNGTVSDTINKASNYLALAAMPSRTNGYRDTVAYTATIQTNGVTVTEATGPVIFYYATYGTNTAVAFSTNNCVAGVTNSLSITNLSRGTNLITAGYANFGNYLGWTNTLLQTVTNHPPVIAGSVVVFRLPGATNHIALTNLASKWSDADGDTLNLTNVATPTTNGINLQFVGFTLPIATTNVSFATNYVGYTNGPNMNDRFSYTISDGYGNATGYVYVLTNSSAVFGQVSDIGYTNKSSVLHFYGISGLGLTYIAQRSLDMIIWVDLSTNTLTTNAVIAITDTNNPSAFYRLKWQP